MRNAIVWGRLLGTVNTIVESLDFEREPQRDPGTDERDDIVIIANVRPRKGARGRCPHCGRRGAKFDNGGGRRRWRALDLGTIRAYLQAEAPRITCRTHGVVVAAVPWARPGARHTLAFDQQAAYLATHTAKSTVGELMRVSWRTVGAILERVWADVEEHTDLLSGLRRIGIDEVAYKKGHKYLVVVVDHDTRRLVWAGIGRERATLQRFFDQLGPERAKEITHISADAASWIENVAGANCPQALVCTDPFHVVAWATEALDRVRRGIWNRLRRGHQLDPKAVPMQRVRFALWKNPENLTDNQRGALARIERDHPTLHRAYLLKEALRAIFHLDDPTDVETTLAHWLAWAQRSRIPEFVELAQRVRRHRHTIAAAVRERLSNGLIESTNTKIRLMTRIAYGFRDPDALIALAMLTLGGHRPTLPGR